MADDRLKKLARNIDAWAEKDEAVLRQTREIEGLRRQGAAELHALCAEFVEAVNALVTRIRLELDPPAFGENDFRDPGVNLFQINARGRVIQIEFRATDTLTSTDRLRTEYTLEGAVRWYNQALLERVEIQEHLLFYCLEKERRTWRYLDAARQRGAPVDQGYLIQLMERLV
jgi:hypothetical protein